jgi:hypothetical protein
MREGLPLAGAFGLFVHLCLTGLVPHLEAREDLVDARRAALDEQAAIEREIEQLEGEAAALEDPIYRERLRRDLARPPAGQHFVPTDEVVPKHER